MARRGRVDRPGFPPRPAPRPTDPAAEADELPRAIDPLDSIADGDAVDVIASPRPLPPEAASAPAPPPMRAASAPLSSGSDTYTLMEVAGHLQINPDTLRSWNSRFGAFLPSDVSGESPRYTSADVAVLLAVRTLQAQGQSDTQIQTSLIPRRILPPPEPAMQAAAGAALTTAMALASQWGQGEGADGAGGMSHVIGDVLSALASGQQTVLNSQSSMREMVSVVVQDNFNLKDENRKLRERMLELERALAEYQRREETRKERYEARLRALEGTVAALQQQMAQFVQMQRAALQKRRGWW